MLLEKIGKLCFAKVRPLFFYLLLTLPLVGALLYLKVEKVRLDELERQFWQSSKKGKSALQRKELKDRFLQQYSHAVPYFLDTYIESLSLLQHENQTLQALLKHPALAEKWAIEARLQDLEGNRLAFTEEAIRHSEHVQETEEKQRNPVQMDEEDLKQLLCLIDNVPIDSFMPQENSPQLIVTDFLLERKESSLKTPFLEVEIKLLKREIKP